MFAPTRKIVITGDDAHTEVHVLGLNGRSHREMISVVRGTILRGLDEHGMIAADRSLVSLALQPEVEWAPSEIGVAVAMSAPLVCDWIAATCDSIAWLRASDPASGRFVAVGIW